MLRFEAVNNYIILLKDKTENNSPLILPTYQPKNMNEIPEPYTGVIDSVGMENEWKKGDRVAFCDTEGLYMKVEDREYVVISPESIIGKLN